jgi:hypothetical protein
MNKNPLDIPILSETIPPGVAKEHLKYKIILPLKGSINYNEGIKQKEYLLRGELDPELTLEDGRPRPGTRICQFYNPEFVDYWTGKNADDQPEGLLFSIDMKYKTKELQVRDMIYMFNDETLRNQNKYKEGLLIFSWVISPHDIYTEKEWVIASEDTLPAQVPIHKDRILTKEEISKENKKFYRHQQFNCDCLKMQYRSTSRLLAIMIAKSGTIFYWKACHGCKRVIRKTHENCPFCKGNSFEIDTDKVRIANEQEYYAAQIGRIPFDKFNPYSYDGLWYVDVFHNSKGATHSEPIILEPLIEKFNGRLNEFIELDQVPPECFPPRTANGEVYELRRICAEANLHLEENAGSITLTINHNSESERLAYETIRNAFKKMHYETKKPYKELLSIVRENEIFPAWVTPNEYQLEKWEEQDFSYRKKHNKEDHAIDKIYDECTLGKPPKKSLWARIFGSNSKED